MNFARKSLHYTTNKQKGYFFLFYRAKKKNTVQLLFKGIFF